MPKLFSFCQKREKLENMGFHPTPAREAGDTIILIKLLLLQCKKLMNKIIKKILFFVFILTFGTVAVFQVFIVALNLPYLNTRVCEKISSTTSELIGFQVEIGAIRFLPFSSIKIKEFNATDQWGKQIIGFRSGEAVINWTGFLVKTVHLDDLTVDSLYCHADLKNDYFSSNKLDTLQGNRTNLRVLVDKFNVVNSGCDVRLKNGKRLNFTDVSLDVCDINAAEDLLSFDVNEIAFFEKDIRRRGELSMNGIMHNDTVSVRDLSAKFGDSWLKSDTAGVDFRDDIIESFLLRVSELHVSSKEFALFINNNYEGSAFESASEVSVFDMRGNFRGTSESIICEDVIVENHDNTRAEIFAEINNYQDLEHSDVSVEVSNARTSDKDILAIFGIDLERNIGKISFGFSAKGPADDIVIDATVASDVGSVHAGFQATIGKDLTLDGTIESDGIDLRELTDGYVGRADFSADVYAHYNGKDVSFVDISGFGREVELNGYSYQNLNSKYRFEKQSAFGALELDDPNGHIIFGGGYDLSTDTAKYFALAIIDSLRLDKTNILPDHPNSSVSGRVRTRFEGSSVDNANGFVSFSNLHLCDGEKYAQIDSVFLKVSSEDEKNISLRSDFLNGSLRGKFLYASLLDELRYQFSRASDALVEAKDYEVPPETYAELVLEYDNLEKLTQFVTDELEFENVGKLYARVNGDNHTGNLTFSVGDVAYGENYLDGLNVDITSNARGIEMSVNLDLLTLFSIGEFGTISLYNILKDNDLRTFASWYDEKNADFNGSISLHTTFSRTFEGLTSRIAFDRNDMYFRGTNWAVLPSTIECTPNGLGFEEFTLRGGERSFYVDGRLSENEGDTLRVELDNVQIENLLHETPDSRFALAGDMSMSLLLSNVDGNFAIKNKTLIEKFYVNHDYLDHVEVEAEWGENQEISTIDVDLFDGDRVCATAHGGYTLSKNYFDLLFNIDRTSVGFLNFYLKDAVKDIKGTASGKLRLYGEVPDIKMDANLGVNPTTFTIRQTLVDYEFVGGDTIYITPDNIVFGDMKFKDRNGHVGNFYGNISHDMFSGLGLNVKFRMNNQLVYDMNVVESPMYYGTLYATGDLLIAGTTNNVELTINAKTSRDYPSTFYILPLERSDFSSNNFVHFVNKNGKVEELDLEELLSSVTASVNVEITDNSTINVVVNSQTGNQMTVKGKGNLSLDVNRSGDLSIQGKYQIESGVYNFSFENILNKRFEINRGSIITWDGGDPYNALLDISATYKLKASLYDLVSGTSGAYNTSDLKRRVPVNCNLLLSGRMSSPDINFKIEIPSTTNSSQYIFDQYVSTDEEMNRQAFSLLLANRFYAIDDGSNGMGSTSSYLGTTASELISNQISSRLSQNKYNIGIGLNYRPGDEVQNEEYEVSFSTQLFDNNVLLSGNLGYGRDVTEEGNGNFIGDFDVEVKLNKKGNLRAKAYTHSNNDVVYETSPTTQGIGIAYGDQFNTFSDLWNKYWYVLSGKRRKDRKVNE